MLQTLKKQAQNLVKEKKNQNNQTLIWKIYLGNPGESDKWK